MCSFNNPNVTELCGYTPLDEKMYGTFHIAVGANNMFGGTNAGLSARFRYAAEHARISYRQGKKIQNKPSPGFCLPQERCKSIAVGANNMFGGTNAASDHIDFVGHGSVLIKE